MSEIKSPLELVEQLGKEAVTQLKNAQKRYRKLRAVSAVLAVIFALVLGSIVGAVVPQNGAAVSQAGQALVAVDGFLAAASGVVAVFYSGKLFEFVSPSSTLMVAMRPILAANFVATAKKEFEKSMQALGERLKIQGSSQLNAGQIAEGQKAVFEALGAMATRLFEDTAKLVREMAVPARHLAGYTAFVLITLIVSAFFSTLAIVSGSTGYLGAGFGFTVLGSGFLALALSDAHVGLIQLLVAEQAHESLKSLPPAPPSQPSLPK